MDSLKAPQEIVELAESFYVPTPGSYSGVSDEKAHKYYLDPVLWAWIYLLNTDQVVVDRITKFGIWYKRGSNYRKTIRVDHFVIYRSKTPYKFGLGFVRSIVGIDYEIVDNMSNEVVLIHNDGEAGLVERV